MKIVNLNTHPVSVKVLVEGRVDYVQLAAKGKIDLPSSFTVDANWLVANPMVKVRS